MALLLKDSPDLELKIESPRRRRKAAAIEADERSLVSPLALKRPGGRAIYWLVFALLLLSTVVALGPMYWMFTGGLKSSLELLATPPTIWPLHPVWSNFIEAWHLLELPLYFTNTLILGVGAVVLQLLVSATAAYALSKLHVAGKSIIQFAFFSTLMVPPVAYLVPQFVNISDLPLIHISLFNSWSGIWLPEAANAFNILLLKSFFDGIPKELTDAARLDGANAWQMFTRIILPLSRPVLAVVTIFTIIGCWTDFLWPLVVLADDNIRTLMVGLYYQSAQHSNLPFNDLIAGIALASIPPIIVFLILQRQIIRGITLTGLKG